ncbi:hypothetical protein D3C80_328640 [compost metagenome]
MTSREPVAVCKALNINSGRCILWRISGFKGLMASLMAKLMGDKRNSGKGCGELHGKYISLFISSKDRNKLNNG